MSKLDEVLARYRARTAIKPAAPVELKVLARLRAAEAASPSAIIALPAFRPGAMAAAMLMGMAAVGLVPMTTATASPDSDLSVFSPDAPQLTILQLGRTS